MLGGFIFLIGVAIGIRYLVYLFGGDSAGHIQSLILAAIFIILGFQTIVMGLLADTIASSRKLLEDVQYRVRKMECRSSNEAEKTNDRTRF